MVEGCGADRVIRVFCVDGPCRGLQFLDLDTGRILLDHRPESPTYIYLVHDHEAALTDFGPSNAAYFQRSEPVGLTGLSPLVPKARQRLTAPIARVCRADPVPRVVG